MKIAFLSTFYPLRGGIAQFNASMYRAMEANHDVKAFTFSRQYPKLLFPGKTQYVQEGDIADQIPSESVLDTINPFSYIKTASKIRKWEPDLLIMKYWMSYFGPSLGWVAKHLSKKTKAITILDNVIPHESRIIDKPFTSYFLKQNDGFIVMSDQVEKDLLSFRPNANYIKHMHPIYNHFGDKTDKQTARKKLGIPVNKKVLLFFGFIRDYKGLDLLIESFSKLPDDYYLLIAGEVYGSFDKYQAQLDKLPNKENIGLHNDYISDEQVPDIFSASDVCVLPYKSATQSGITYISYHFDLPIIATDVGGLKDTVLHEKTGLIVNQPNSNKIREGIIQYFDSKDKIDYQSGITSLKKQLSWEHFGESIIDFYKTL